MPLRVPARAALLVALASTHGLAQRADAQAVDTSHKWSLFGGVPSLRTGQGGTTLLDENQFGLSREFTTTQFPLSLRASAAFTHTQNSFTLESQKAGSLSLDAIARSRPLLFGSRVYALGGLGMETIAPRTQYLGYSDPAARVQFPAVVRSLGRQNFAFAQFGAGVEWKRLFLEMRKTTPVASNGVSRTPFVLGIHF